MGYLGHWPRRFAVGAIAIGTTVSVLLMGSPAISAPEQFDTEARADLIRLAQRYLDDRGSRLTSDSANGTKLTAVPVSGQLAAKLVGDRDAIDDRRRLLRKVNGGHARADIDILSPSFEVRTDAVDMRFTEHTKLHFARQRPDAPKYEEYGIRRTFTFTRSAGTWVLDNVAADLGDGILAPDTEPTLKPSMPTEMPPSARPTSNPIRPVAAGAAVPMKPLAAKSGSAVDSAGVSYDYGAMLAYAHQYWGPEESNYNSAYRVYTGLGGDCTNFISQIVGRGGWTTVGSWPANNRTWNEYWFYGLYTWSTSYSWAAAENWWWFAQYHSGRTTYLDNVWKMLVTDVMQIDFDRNNNLDHSMFVTGRAGYASEYADELYMTYHSSNTHDRPLSTIIATSADAWYYTHRT
jgi:hypothetical protein